LKQSPTHEGHELLPEEQRSTQQKSRIVSNFLLPCVFTQRGFSIEYSSINQHNFTAKSSGLSTMNATVKESLSILKWINQSKQLFHMMFG
jgi:hypothetical protein